MEQFFVMEKHNQVISDLSMNLEKVETSSDQVIRQMELSINHCKKALEQIRELVIQEGFPDQESEIYFFKTIKPQVNSKLFFFISVFDIQTRRPSGNMECQVKALKREQKLANLFLLKNQEIYQYYRSGSIILDHRYFLRGTFDLLLVAKNPLIFDDPVFSTGYDYLFSMVIANEMLMVFVEQEIQKLRCTKLNKCDKSMQVPDIEVVWTDTKIALIELLYAVDSLGSINKGNIDIKRLGKFFGRALNIDLGDLYHAFGEIKMRKKERTKYLDSLKSALIKRMDESDAR